MMSKAINTVDPKFSQLTTGVCPDQWGVWFPDDPAQMDPRQAWQEMAEAGVRCRRDRSIWLLSHRSRGTPEVV